jgi:hypothetical protein
MKSLSIQGFTYGDKRIDNRAIDFFNKMRENGTIVIRRLSEICTKAQGFHRLLENEKFTVEKMIEDTAFQAIQATYGSDHLLAVHDTTEVMFEAETTKHRRNGLGPLSKSFCRGFFVHPVILVDANDMTIQGISDIKIWVRPEPETPRLKDKNGKSIPNKEYTKLPIEEKESYRWIEVAENTKRRFPDIKTITFISDRESDIYEEWDRIPDLRTHLIIRASSNRKLLNDEKLFSKLASLPIRCTYDLELCAIFGKRSARRAKIEVSYTTVEIKKPKDCNDKNAKETVILNAIQVKEITEGVLENDRILWRILTTHEISTNEDVLKIIFWYKNRWIIEQLFRNYKKQGMNIEASQIRDVEKLEKIVIAALITSVKSMQLVEARDGENNRTVLDVFGREDIPVLEKLIPTLEGRTEKQKNPHPPRSLAWSSWIIGRLGGWKGYKSEKPPGPITMTRGLERFYSIKIGYMLN